jgi:ABC-type nitrate/sulfonate/bicarbonate transport system substrate-binding protein
VALAGMPGLVRRANAAALLIFQASWINDAEFTGYFVAADQGYYTAEGLDLTYLPGGPDVIPESSLIAGKADVTLTTPDTTVSAIVDQGAKFNLKSFHDFVWKNGNVPIALQRWEYVGVKPEGL